MKIQILSDVHVEFHRDLGVSWLKSIKEDLVTIPAEDKPEVLVVAGDLGVMECLDHTLMGLCAMYSHVVYVVGNHEYYKHSPDEVHRELTKLTSRHKNLHWLHNQTVEIGGVKFAGTPLWFRDDPMNAVHANKLSDFLVIRKFVPWVYEQNKAAIEFLAHGATKADVVVTHHLPHPKCVDPYWRGSSLNRFFLCDVTEHIMAIAPKLWVFGHSHSSADFMVGPTRILANPMGYVNSPNPKFEDKLIVEVAPG